MFYILPLRCYINLMDKDLERLIELQRLLLSFSQVDRRVHRKHGEDYILENDTEHSYNLAMTAWYLANWFPELKVDLILKYALVHDLVEVHAGDTYVYGTADELSSKEQREAEALKKLESDWPDFPDMHQTIHAYEKRLDAESKFVYALDKIMPIILIYIHDGYTWKKEGVTVEMLHDAKFDKISVSPEILPYFTKLHALLTQRPDLIQYK